MYLYGPSSKVSAAVFGTVHLVITCARGGSSRSVNVAGDARARRADEIAAPTVKACNNICLQAGCGEDEC